MLEAKFEYGSKVRLIKNVRNDGSFAGARRGERLVRRGEVGYVRQIGVFLQEHIIYQVHFLDINLVVGCKETELMDADEPWQQNRFEYGDKAMLTVSLSQERKVIASSGTPVSILAVQRPESNLTDSEITYRIQVGELDVVVPERALKEVREAYI